MVTIVRKLIGGSTGSLSTIRRYLLALLITGIAIALRAALWPVLGTQAPLLLLIVPVVMSAWFLGVGPGLVSTIICAIAGLYLFIPPILTFKTIDPSDWVRLLIFCFEGGLISGLSWWVQRAQQAASTAQAKESASDDRFRSLVESVQDYAIMMLDPAGFITSWNSAATQIFGYRELDMLGQHIRNFYLSDAQADELPEKEIQYATTTGRFEDEGWRLRQDGTRFWAHVILTAVVDATGTLQGFANMVQDTTERERADQAIRTSQARLQGILASAMDAIITVDTTQHIILFNNAAEKTFGYQAAEVLGQPLSILLPVRFRTRHASFVTQFGRSGITTRSMHPGGTLAALHRDGHEFPIEASISHVLVEDQPLYTVILRDVTTRVQADAALRAAEARFAQAFEASSVAIIITRADDARIVDANPRFLALVGRDRDAVVGKTSLDIGLWADTNDRTRLLTLLEHQAQVRDYEAIICDLNRTLHTVLISVVPIDVDGVACRLITLYDITDRIQAETERQRSAARFRALVLATTQIIWTSNAVGLMVEDSASWRAFTGQTFEEYRGNGWLACVHPDDRNRSEADWQVAVRTGTGYMVEHRLRRYDGVYRTMQARGVPIRDAAGTILEWIGSHTDVTEQQELEARYLQAQKLEIVGRLAGGVAHDFNNLLTAITGYTQVVMDELPTESSIQDDLQEIIRAAQRASALTSQLLSFSRQQVMHLQVVDVNALIRELEKLLRRLLSADIELVVTLDPETGSIAGDMGQIEQVLVNLVINARDAMPEGGTITLSTQEIAGQGHPAVAIAVRDTGVGIPDDVRPHLFEPFFTTKPVGRGTGLGLATCYGIVQQHGGTIEVESIVGQGSTFTIWLPAVAAPTVERPHNKQFAATLGGNETILLVEDEDIVRQLAGRVLREAGYTVIEATNGVEALAFINTSERPRLDLILTDVVMPQLGGVEVILQAIRHLPGVAVLLMSGYTEHQSLARAQALDLPLLPKPFTPLALTQAVRQAIDGRSRAVHHTR